MRKVKSLLVTAVAILSTINPAIAKADIGNFASNPEFVVSNMKVADGKVTATLLNSGQLTGTDTVVSLRVDGTEEAKQVLSSLGGGKSEQLTFNLVSPLPQGTSTVSLIVDPYDEFYENWSPDGQSNNSGTYLEYATTASVTVSKVDHPVDNDEIMPRNIDPFEQSMDIANEIISGRLDKLNAVVVAPSSWQNQGTANILAGVLAVPLITLPTADGQIEQVRQFALAHLSKTATVYLVGTKGSIPDSYAENLADAGLDVKQVTGIDLTELSTNIAKEVAANRTLKGKAPVVIATTASFADEATVAPFAIQNQAPVILVDNKTFISTDDNTASLPYTLTEASNIYVVGGKGAVPEDTEGSFRIVNHVISTRVAGLDRYETNSLVNSTLYNQYPMNSVMAGDESGALQGALLASLSGRQLQLMK